MSESFFTEGERTIAVLKGELEHEKKCHETTNMELQRARERIWEERLLFAAETYQRIERQMRGSSGPFTEICTAAADMLLAAAQRDDMALFGWNEAVIRYRRAQRKHV